MDDYTRGIIMGVKISEEMLREGRKVVVTSEELTGNPVQAVLESLFDKMIEVFERTQLTIRDSSR